MRHASSVLNGVLLALAISGMARSDSRVVDARPGLVELDAGELTGDVAVSWEARQPVALTYRVYHLADARRVCVFHAIQDTQYVIVSDVIDWDKRTRVKTSWIVNVGSPGPGPDPNPDPDPPAPSPRPLCFAGDVYDAAKAVDRPTEARAILGAFEAVHAELAARADMTPRETQQRLTEQLRVLNLPTEWTAFFRSISDYLNTNAKSRSAVLAAYEQIAIGLGAAVK